MSTTPPFYVELDRLRLNHNVLDNLNLVLEFIDKHGFSAMRPTDTDYSDFIVDWHHVGNGKGFGLPGPGNDTKAAMKILGLVEGDGLSEFGRCVLQNWNDQELVKNKFAQKLIVCNGLWALCHVISLFSGKTKEKILDVYREFYQEDIADEQQTIGAWNEVLEWLGITNAAFEFIENGFKQRIGIDMSEYHAVGQLDLNSKDLLFSLLRLSVGEKEWKKVTDIKNMYKQITGKNISKLTQTIVANGKKLADEGWIEKIDGEGRGTSGKWKITDRAKDLHDEILKDFIKNPNPTQVLDALKQSYIDIANEIENPPQNVASTEIGKPFEIFAAKILWDLGAKSIRLNVEDVMERDVIGIITQPLFQRILCQCKNWKDKVGMPEIIKEVGIATSEKYDSIIFFARKGFTGGTESWVDGIMVKTGIKIYLIGKEDVEKLLEDPKKLWSIMEDKSKHIGEVMEAQDSVLEELSRLKHFRDNLIEMGWTPPNENTAEESEN